MGMSSINFQSNMFWGLIFLMQILKVGVPDVEFKSFTTHVESLGFEFPSNCGSP